MDRNIKKIPLYYGGKRQTFPETGPGGNHMSGSVVFNNIIFLSCMDGRSFDSGIISSNNVRHQTEMCLENIQRLMKESGSSIENIIKMFIMVRNYESLAEIWQVMLAYFGKNAPLLVKEPPVMTVTQVESLSIPDALVAIDSIGVISREDETCRVRNYPLIRKPAGQADPETARVESFMSESVVMGNLVFISGMTGNSPGSREAKSNTFEDQWLAALDRVNRAMDKAGTSMNNIIKTLHFQTRLDNLMEKGEDDVSHSPASDRLWKTELEYFDRFAPLLMDEPPASTFLKVSSLSDPALKGQTEVTGVLSRYMPGWEVKKYPLYLGVRGFPRHMGEIKKYYANSVRVGNLVFISGQTSTDSYSARIESDFFDDQVKTALDNLRMAVEESGSALENIIKTTVLLPDPGNLRRMREIGHEYFKKYAPILLREPPAGTVIHPLNLASPAMHVEIEAISFV